MDVMIARKSKSPCKMEGVFIPFPLSDIHIPDTFDVLVPIMYLVRATLKMLFSSFDCLTFFPSSVIIFPNIPQEIS